ncbi:MAG: nucleotide pyrophosphohydrolase [Planctomycetes bacterium]|nr:nucleotide pyrophosphohydrolase [Planctomycetota bacterium]
MNDDTTTVGELKRLLTKFVAEREWEMYHDPKNLSMSIAIEAAELMEHFQWVRTEELDELRKNEQAMAEIRDELADVTAYVLALANALDLDLASALADKMEKNALKYPAAEFRGRYFKPAAGAEPS